MHLKSRQVEAFQSVMTNGSITAAAEAMNVTQPAVSRLIRDLEISVSIPLFERQGTRLVPTPEALLLFSEVERLYLGLDQIAQAAEDIRRHKSIVLRIASVSSLMRPFLHEAILAEVGPRLDPPLVIDVENSRHITDMVEKNRYDLGFVFGAARLAERNTTLLFKSSVMAVMAQTHPLAVRDRLTPKDLGGDRLLIPGRSSPLRFEIDRVLAGADGLPASLMETSLINCCHFAAAGMGVGIVDQVSIVAAGADIVSVPFFPLIQTSYFAIRPPGSKGIPFLEQIVKNMQDALPPIPSV